jgi:hypothetical protein
MSVVEDSPSAERRKALKEADAANELRVLGSCPLSKYIDIADRLLDHFQNAVDGRRLDEAYVFGLRFANLCLSSLPKHPEWKHDTRSKARKRLTSEVGDVLCMMDVIKQRMDAEELMKIKAELIAKEEEEARKKEAEDRGRQQLDEARQREQKIRDALKEERQKFLAEQRSSREKAIQQKVIIAKKKEPVPKVKEIEKSAMAKLQAMQAQMSSSEEHAVPGEQSVTASKKNVKSVKSSKSSKIKVSAPKISFSMGKKKSKGKSKEEKAKLPSRSPTQPTEINNEPVTVLVASVGKEELDGTKNKSDSITERDGREQNLGRKSSLGENSERKTNIVNSTEKQQSKSESEGNDKKMTVTDSTESQEDKIEASFDANSSRRATKSKKYDTDLTSSLKSTMSTSMNFFKSKIETAKSSISTIPSSIVPPSVSSSPVNITSALLTPRSQKEKTTIDKLKRAISAQEDRLEEIEGKQIPTLLQAAKTFLKEDKKQEALKCLAHKKKLERQVDKTKAAVFNMETQMFMLESALEDRYVKKALDEAATAIAGFQKNIGDPKADIVDLTNISLSLPELDVGDSSDEELLEELEEWLSPEDKRKSRANKDSYANADDISLLSMPSFLPVAPADTPTSTSVGNFLGAIIGE